MKKITQVLFNIALFKLLDHIQVVGLSKAYLFSFFNKISAFMHVFFDSLAFQFRVDGINNKGAEWLYFFHYFIKK